MEWTEERMGRRIHVYRDAVSLCVCMCVSVCLCVSACVSACVFVCLHVCLRVSIRVSVCVMGNGGFVSWHARRLVINFG